MVKNNGEEEAQFCMTSSVGWAYLTEDFFNVLDLYVIRNVNVVVGVLLMYSCTRIMQKVIQFFIYSKTR